MLTQAARASFEKVLGECPLDLFYRSSRSASAPDWPGGSPGCARSASSRGPATDPEDAGSAGHRTRPHTADVIIEAWAPTFEECLAEAVAALTDTYASSFHAGSVGRHTFRLTAFSREQALLAVLEEALYVLDARGAVVVAAHLEAGTGTSVSGWFDLARVDESRLVGSVPKGIALSGLRIQDTGRGRRCSATVDV